MARLLVPFAALGIVATGGCASPCPPAAPAPGPAWPAAPPPTTAAPSAQPVAPAARERDKVAVLPLDDGKLFRNERAGLRQLLQGELVKHAPDLDVLPLTEVDRKLRPLAKSGTRCAYPAPLTRRAQDKGWLATDVMHVLGPRGKPEELWVTVAGSVGSGITFAGTWNPKLDRKSRYRAAFTSLAPKPDAGVLGGLAGRPTRKNKLTANGLTLCETASFGECTPETKKFADAAPALAKCFAGTDATSRELLFEGTARCELAGLDDTKGPDAHLEACLCRALLASSGVRGRAGRRRVDLDYEAPDLAGKPRPELRVVEASHNLFANADWHSQKHVQGGKTTYTSVRRLVVDNLDGLRAPLARCRLDPGSIVFAALSLDEAGFVTSADVRSGARTKAESSCLVRALSRGAFNCTTDGKPASLRVAIVWPGGK